MQLYRYYLITKVIGCRPSFGFIVIYLKLSVHHDTAFELVHETVEEKNLSQRLNQFFENSIVFESELSNSFPNHRGRKRVDP